MDPRLSVLGQRAVLAGPPQSSESAPSIYSRQYRHWRIEHGVAEGNEEIPAGVHITQLCILAHMALAPSGSAGATVGPPC